MNYILIIVLFSFTLQLAAQDTIIPLWPIHKIPNSIESNAQEVHERNGVLRISDVQEPTLEVYLPAAKNATGSAVLIFPGGGYGILAYDWEGTDIAKFLNGKGIAGIVVKYRLPSSKSQMNKHSVPLIDAQRAIRIVRSMADSWHFSPSKIGIIGFSAGGHLASTLGTRYDNEVYEAVDEVDDYSARPDFMALGYPVITFGDATHKGSKINLLGEEPDPELEVYFSNEKQVTENTPPTFLFHATDDESVPVENSLLFYRALRDKGVSATMHIYPKGGHGFSLALNDRHLSGWTDRWIEWMQNLD